MAENEERMDVDQPAEEGEPSTKAAAPKSKGPKSGKKGMRALCLCRTSVFTKPCTSLHTLHA